MIIYLHADRDAINPYHVLHTFNDGSIVEWRGAGWKMVDLDAMAHALDLTKKPRAVALDQPGYGAY